MAEGRIPPGFEDFDLSSVYARYASAGLQADTLNFVIDFDSSTAFAALNLDLESIEKALQTERAGTTKSRWINIWGPERQKDVVKALAGHYGFSPRLLGVMCDKHMTPAGPVIDDPHHTNRVQAYVNSKIRSERKSVETESPSPDLEKLEMRDSPRSAGSMLDLNHYRIADEVWHFSSVDLGPRYLCIGYNSLHNTQGPPIDASDSEERPKKMPHGKRLWTWLVLCDDGTVISMHETPFPNHRQDLNLGQQKDLSIIRRNLLNVFKQLSKANDAERASNPIMTLAIRSGLQSDEEGKITSTDSPSLLFYYIFDDWVASYNLVARTEHQYRDQLEKLREDMFRKPEVGHIGKLHNTGRQLAVLKRMYQSYAMIIERILVRQKPMDALGTSMQSLLSGHDTQTIKDEPVAPRNGLTAQAKVLGVFLAPASAVRFERLKDRISLYALSEIQDCLDEKDALVFLNFNLITLKESQAIERLTRITILLAKVTILFMPVSLMTGYFSVQISDLQGVYTVQTYWICFAVIMALSFSFLVVFGKLSGTLEGKPIYRSMTETFYDFGMHALGSRRSKRAH